MSLLKVHICSSSEGFVTWDGNASSKSWKTSLKKKNPVLGMIDFPSSWSRELKRLPKQYRLFPLPFVTSQNLKSKTVLLMTLDLEEMDWK